MCAPDAPAPPDPKQTSAAQTGTNIGTAIANNTMGMINQVTPDGNLTYATTGSTKWTDPFTGQVYDIPSYTATTSLSEAGTAIKGQNDATKLNLATIGNNQSGFLKDYLSQPWNADTEATEARLWDLNMKRLEPQFAREEEGLRTRLANQGVTPGSEAWNREMEGFRGAKGNTWNDLALAGRGQAFAESQALRNQPINEISALLSNSQVSNPSVAMMQPQGAATTDVAGLINQNYNQRQANYQSEVAQRGSLLGGLFGLGAAGITGGMFGGGKLFGGNAWG